MTTAAQDVVISEFMAANESTLVDEDGAYSDWIELHNSSDRRVLLSGWSLSDDADEPQRWRFPEVTMEPGGFLLVFASGKDRREPGSELHTNFKLSSGGETLILMDPLRRFASRYANYPTQQPDTSYGALMELSSETLVESGAQTAYHVPENRDLGLTWVDRDFDDAAWMRGPTGIGFDAKEVPTYTDLIATDVGALMQDESATLYLRIPFTLGVDDIGKNMRLRAQFDDGIAVFVNGVEVARESILSPTLTNVTRARERGGALARTFESIPLIATDLQEALVDGENTLAILLANRSRRDDDALVVPELDLIEVASIDLTQRRFYPSATPGWPNLDPRLGVTKAPTFSDDGGLFTETFQLTMEVDDPEAEIRYTTNGSLPTESSTLYEGPIEVSNTTSLTARAFRAGYLPSDLQSRYFVAVREFEFDSNLPVVVVVANSGVGGSFVPMSMLVFDRDENGRAKSDAVPVFGDSGVIKTRGSSTGGRAKASYSLEIQDAFGDDKDVSILGLPAGSDWILYGAYNFDRAHIRNAFMYELSNRVGRYAVRTRFCEVYLTTNGSSLSSAHYRGVYTFMEKIKRGEHRVNVEQLGPESSEADVAGGYIVKIDRLDPGDSGFTAAGRGQMAYVYPKEEDITVAQREFLEQFFDRFNRSLTGDDRDHPNLGFRAFIDEYSWIDHHLLNEFTKNPDALGLSTYLHKTRDGPLENGPIWDFDRTLGPDDDDRAQDPVGWMGARSSAWWGTLLGIPSYLRNYRDRWQELRATEMKTDSLLRLIDEMAEEIGEAGGRDAGRWRQVDGQQGFENEITQLKSWVSRRVEWMDSQLVVPPELSHEGGRVDAGLEVTIEAPVGEIYYTINGEDPREDASRQLYQGEAIVITGNSRIRARVQFSPTVWSLMVEAIYVVDVPTLAITEILYNPLDGEPEFVELTNFGAASVDMTGMILRYGRRERFVFADELALAPGEYLVLTDDMAAFVATYGEGIAYGEASGTLSNASTTIGIEGTVGDGLVSVKYNDDWYPETDGKGPSLELLDPRSDPESWNSAEAWRASPVSGGTPGTGIATGELSLPGDLDRNGALNLTDAVALLQFLFQGIGELPCSTDSGDRALADVNGDDLVNLSDSIYTLRYLFVAGPPPTLGIECTPIIGCQEACVAAE